MFGLGSAFAKLFEEIYVAWQGYQSITPIQKLHDGSWHFTIPMADVFISIYQVWFYISQPAQHNNLSTESVYNDTFWHGSIFCINGRLSR